MRLFLDWLNENNINIQINMDDYNVSLKKSMDSLADYLSTEKERLSTFKLDIPKLKGELQRISYPAADKIIQSLNNKEALESAAEELYRWGKNQLHIVRPIVKYLWDYLETHSADYDPEEFKKDFIRLQQQTYKNMEVIVGKIQQAISRLDWNGSPIIVEAFPVGDNSFNPSEDALIHVGEASFTYFNGKAEVDDMIEGGDEDFFDSSKAQEDYFNLVKELTEPYSTQKGKIITLYTARPKKDHDRYENAETLPANIFLTSNYNSAVGIGSDFGDREIWKVRINTRYLTKTLDGVEKHYQTVREAPVVSIEQT